MKKVHISLVDGGLSVRKCRFLSLIWRVIRDAPGKNEGVVPELAGFSG